ncbi:hypothetical protein BS78_04G090300, partial [Paspalum vaginatum]
MKRCFACNQTSHSLDQCKMKNKLVTVAHQIGYATKFPFSMIWASEEMVETENFYHNCVLITSNVSNLDLGIVKGELQKFWKLSGGWELRRECRKSFLASLSSEGDVISSLKHPKMETLLDDKEVTFSVTRWMEGGDEVCGVPRIYRTWNGLYQVASAFGVLIEVDEESLEVGDKGPIRLKIALRSLDDAPFSHRFVFGRSSRMIMLTVEGAKCIEVSTLNGETKDNQIRTPAATINNSNKTTTLEATITNSSETTVETKCIEQSRLNGETNNNQISDPAATMTGSNETTTETSKSEEVQSNGQSPTSMIGEEHYKGIPKPPIKHVFKRRVIVPRAEELKHIMQFYLRVEKEELKLGKLYALFMATDVRKIIIFVNTKDKVTSLTKDVKSDHTVLKCHDGMDQHARDAAIQMFLSGSSNILITNGIQGTKALHVPIPIVINYDLPTQPMQYLRRILQQNGQSGRKSVVISMVKPSDEGILSDIRRFSNSKMREL